MVSARAVVQILVGLRGYFYNEMRYINLRFTYLLTYLAMSLSNSLRSSSVSPLNEHKVVCVSRFFDNWILSAWPGMVCQWSLAITI